MDADGPPVLNSPGNWVLVRRGGQERAALGTRPLDILRRDDPLVEGLLDGARPQVAAGEDRPRSARDERWSDADRSDGDRVVAPRFACPVPARTRRSGIPATRCNSG